MNRPKKYLPEYLSFTRKERTGIIVIVAFILAFVIAPFLFPFFIKSKPIDHTAFEKEIAVLNLQEDSNQYFTGSTYEKSNPRYLRRAGSTDYSKQLRGELFYFDPNTLPATGWVKLGIREKTANTIQNFVAKGGRFYKPEDIGKIWGLHEDEINRLIPYVQIESNSAAENYQPNKTAPFKKFEKPVNTIAPVDINQADSSAFIALPGIGSKLAGRIINFRDKLGGFYKVDQVAETFALPDSTFQKIKNKLVLSSRSVNQLNINSATIDELKIHPYIRYNLANAIVQYRNQHGNFSSINDLRGITIFTAELFDKAAPYLTVK
ncbi:MAG: helix-hairpin-helix domain-containing protein [Ferruginibacter sp.]